MDSLCTNFHSCLLWGTLIGLVALGLLTWLVAWFFRRKYRAFIVKNQELNQHITSIQSDFKDQVDRFEYILENYKKNAKKSENAQNIHNEQFADFIKAETDDKIKDLVKQKRELEIEKQNFLDKNKKLWEQSIAIHKEKDRIDRIKRDIEQRHGELTDSIRYAQRIQQALLPKEKDIAPLFKDYFILWKPRDIVSGDFFWIKKAGNFTIVVVADCTGHGVPGAFMSMLGISFLNEIINHLAEIRADLILEQLRDLVKTSLAQRYDSDTANDGMDLALCVIDHTRNVLQFSGANNPLIHIRGNQLETIKATRSPIAIYPKERPFEMVEIELQVQDRFYLFSDGYLDQFSNNNQERLGSKRFRQLLLKHLSDPLNRHTEILKEELRSWQGENKQIDDILVMGFSPLG